MSVCCVIGGGSHTKITDMEAWKRFVNELNNPTPENTNNRNRFFEECDKLTITHKEDSVSIESDGLNEAEIIANLSP